MRRPPDNTTGRLGYLAGLNDIGENRTILIDNSEGFFVSLLLCVG